MNKRRKTDPIDSLAEGYEQMLERAVKDAYHSEQKTEGSLHDLIHDARDKAVELGELTHHEAERLAKSLARDINDIKTYVSETGHEIKHWLGFETALLETEIFDLLLKVADDTTVDLMLLKAAAQGRGKYLKDEVTGPGTLVCDECGGKLQLRRPTTIPSCKACSGKSYHRS